MRFILSIVLLVFTTFSYAEPFNGWTDKEKILYGTATLAMLADYKSTASVLYPNQGYKEMNPFLGEQPSKSKLTAWFIGWAIGHYFIVNNLDHEYRTDYLLTVTIVHGLAATHNVSIGAKIQF